MRMKKTRKKKKTGQMKRRGGVTVLLVSRQQPTSVAITWSPIWSWLEQAHTGTQPLKHGGKAHTSIPQRQQAGSLILSV